MFPEFIVFLSKNNYFKNRCYQVTEFSYTLVQNQPETYYIFNKTNKLYVSKFTFELLLYLRKKQEIQMFLNKYSEYDRYELYLAVGKSICLLERNHFLERAGAHHADNFL